MNLKEYRNNWRKLRVRCHWQTLNDFMAIPIFTEERIKNMSDSHKGKYHNGTFKRGHKTNVGRIAWNRGKTGIFSPQVIEKIRLRTIGNKSRTGMTNSEEHKRKNSIRFTGSGNPFYGKKHTEETKEKFRNRKASEETRRKIGLASKGRHWIATEEFKQKHREIFKNRKAGPFKDTKPERMMQIALSLNGIKFEKHKPIKIGKSWHQVDIFIEPNICVEVDGVYFHLMRHHVKRDLFINQELTIMGYHVIRIRDRDIIKNTQNCAQTVIKLINDLQHGVRIF